MAAVLEHCEKEITEQLKKLDGFRKALEDALAAIKKVKEQQKSLPNINASELLQKIVSDAVITEEHAFNNKEETGGKIDISSDQVLHSTASDVVVVKENLTSKVESIPDDCEVEESGKDPLIEHLLRVAGAKKGVKYKIEVKSPLHADGTFWACHVESGFIHSKLEPMSDRLRQATQQDKSLWRVEDHTKLVCTKSSENGLWMRAIIVKELNKHLMRIRFIDIGQTEDCPKSRLSSVPAELAAIPFMAFNCALIPGNVKLQYEAKWRFSDLTKKKILDFTVEEMEERNGIPYLYGQLETILDDPKINISAEIKRFAREITTGPETIMSRDIRTTAGSNENFTSVTEIIRKSISDDKEEAESEQAQGDKVEPPTNLEENTKIEAVEQQEDTNIQKEKSVTVIEEPKKHPNLPPLEIPTTPPKSDGMEWGESKTPGAEDSELELPLLDDKMFDTTPDISNNTQDPLSNVPGQEASGNTVRPAGLLASQKPVFKLGGSEIRPEITQQGINEIHTQLGMLLQYEKELLQLPQPPPQLAPVQQNIHMLRLKLEEIKVQAQIQMNQALGAQHQHQQQQQQQPRELYQNRSAASPPNMQQTSQPGNFSYPNKSMSPPLQQLPQLSQQQIQQLQQQQQMMQQQQQFQQQRQGPLISPTSQMPIGTRFINPPPQHHQQVNNQQHQQTNNQQSSYFSEDVKRPNDYNLKLQQLDAITRSLQMPSDILDKQQMQQLQIAKQNLEKQLHEEELRKQQMEAMIKQSVLKGVPPQQFNQAMQQLSMQQQQQHGYQTTFPSVMTPQMTQQMTSQTPPNVHESSIKPLSNNYVPQNAVLSAQKEMNKESSKQSAEENEPVKNVLKNSETTEPSGSVVSECFASDQPPAKAVTKPFEFAYLNILFTETYEQWATREISNLRHSYLKHPRARFYSVVHIESRPGKFQPFLEKCYLSGYYRIWDGDAASFQKDWEGNDAPLFLIIKHKPCDSMEPWRIGGIVQVLDQCSRVPDHLHSANSYFNHQAKSRFISTAMIVDDKRSFDTRTDKHNRQLSNPQAMKIIDVLIENIKSGKAKNLFFHIKEVQDKEKSLRSEREHSGHSSSYQNKNEHRSSPQRRASPNTSHEHLNKPSQHEKSNHGEDWDLDLNDDEPQGKSQPTSLTSSVSHFGSDDEGERNLNAELEAFGLDDEDLP